MNTTRSKEQVKTTRSVAIDMAMDLCIDEKDEERESEAQSAVTAKKRAAECILNMFAKLSSTGSAPSDPLKGS